MRVVMRFAVLIGLSLVAAGCAGGLGVYESEFSCPQTYNGRCISVPDAHDLALKGHDGPEYDPNVESSVVKKKAQQEDGLASGEESAHVSYKQSLFKRFDDLLQEPATPVVAPPQVMRVLLLPYKGDGNELYMLRHVYFFVDEPRWVLGDSLIALEEEE